MQGDAISIRKLGVINVLWLVPIRRGFVRQSGSSCREPVPPHTTSITNTNDSGESNESLASPYLVLIQKTNCSEGGRKSFSSTEVCARCEFVLHNCRNLRVYDYVMSSRCVFFIRTARI